jgi:hypothetical protein
MKRRHLVELQGKNKRALGIQLYAKSIDYFFSVLEYIIFLLKH